MGTIGDRTALGSVVKMDDWNQYIVIVRGGTFVNGQSAISGSARSTDKPQPAGGRAARRRR